jgi:small subunit ribosomal protein S8
MFTDPIADYLTRVRNAQMAGLKVVDIPASNMKKAITEILHEKGYILNFKYEDSDNNQGNIKVALKYNAQTNLPAIKKLTRISKPGLRKYADAKTLPRVINGLGIAILSTSKGVITDKEARNLNVGGEVICHIY